MLNLLNTVKSDYSLYFKVYVEISHLQKKTKEFGSKLTPADDELLDRLADLVEQLLSVKNQLEGMVKWI